MAYQWVATNGGNIPPNAVRGGYDGKLELFVARARNPRDGHLTAGKAAHTLQGCYISHEKQEILVKDYEVLTIPPKYSKNLVWEFCTDGKLPDCAIPTDPEAKLYISRIVHKDSLTPGKFQKGSEKAHIGYGGEEHSSKCYEILCYYKPPTMMAYQWIPTSGNKIPTNAVRGGYDGKLELFVARARNPREGHLTAGKAAHTLQGCCISYDKQEILVKDYEVLTMPPEYRKNLVWEFCTDGKLPDCAIPTDPEAKLYISRIVHKDTLTPGKFQKGLEMAHIGYGGEEHFSKSYEILCYYD